MKKIIMILALVVMVISMSCKKDIIQDKQESLQNSETLKSKGAVAKSGEELFKASEKGLIQNSKLFVEKFLAIAKTKSNTARPSRCGSMDNVNNQFVNATSTDGFCGTVGTTTLYYYTTIIEHAGINSLDYTFNLEMGGGVNSVGTSSQAGPNNVMLCMPYVPACGDDYCYFVKTYFVTYTIPTAWFTLGGGLIETTGTCGGTSTLHPDNAAFHVTDYIYLNSPARIYLYPGTGGFNLLTECAILCYPDFVTCPNSGTITYQLQSAISPNPNPVIVLNFPFFGIGSVMAAAGTYDYTCILTYSFGNSLPLTGTFTVN
jgi:hypothetical protein